MGKVQKMGGSVLSISANCLGSSQQGQVPTGQVRAGKGSFSLTISAAPTGSRDLGGVPFVRLDLQQTKLDFSHRMREFSALPKHQLVLERVGRSLLAVNEQRTKGLRFSDCRAPPCGHLPKPHEFLEPGSLLAVPCVLSSSHACSPSG